MRIAFDLDGVLADLHTPFTRAAVELFPAIDPSAIAPPDVGASPPDDEADGTDPPAAVRDLPLSRAQAGAVWKRLVARPDFWEDLDETEPGVVARLAAVAEARRWEILFVTSRPGSAGRTVQRQTQRWLEARGFSLPSVYVVHGSRGRVADALVLDALVDDRPDNCLDVVLESRAGALLVWRGDARSVPASARHHGIVTVPSAARAVEVLIEAEKGEGGLLDRLRRLFGLSAGSTSLRR